MHELTSPRELRPAAVQEDLEYRALARQVSARPQHQSVDELVCLSAQVRGAPLGPRGALTRAHRPKRLPVGLSRAAVNRVREAFTGTARLRAGLWSGRGWRVMQGGRLGVKDVEVAHRQSLVREGTGHRPGAGLRRG